MGTKIRPLERPLGVDAASVHSSDLKSRPEIEGGARQPSDEGEATDWLGANSIFELTSLAHPGTILQHPMDRSWERNFATARGSSRQEAAPENRATTTIAKVVVAPTYEAVALSPRRKQRVLIVANLVEVGNAQIP